MIYCLSAGDTTVWTWCGSVYVWRGTFTYSSTTSETRSQWRHWFTGLGTNGGESS